MTEQWRVFSLESPAANISSVRVRPKLPHWACNAAGSLKWLLVLGMTAVRLHVHVRVCFFFKRLACLTWNSNNHQLCPRQMLQALLPRLVLSSVAPTAHL